MTEMFLLSVLGIFAVLAGSIILNIMYNLTAIAEGEKAKESSTKDSKRLFLYFLCSLIAIFALLYAGDKLASKKRENYLINSASDLVAEQKAIVANLSDYSFSRQYIESASQNIKLLSKIEEKFPRVTVIVRDQIEGKSVLLGFGSHFYRNKDEKPLKVDYILGTSSEERKYLNAVFDGQSSKFRFSSNDGRYEIYFPVKTKKGQVVLHLSQYSRYGKFGS